MGPPAQLYVGKYPTSKRIGSVIPKFMVLAPAVLDRRNWSRANFDGLPVLQRMVCLIAGARPVG